MKSNRTTKKPTELALLGLLCVGAWIAGVCGCASSPPAPDVSAQADHSAETLRLAAGQDEVVSVLANGMTVICKRINSPVVSVRGLVRAGSIHEGRWLGGGLSHLLEHLVAGGTNARRNEAQNRNLLQEIGNDSNAYTYPDHTGYYVNTTPANLDRAVDLVTGWIFTASITPDEFARERQVVQRELEMNLGNPQWVFYDLIRSARYRQSPAGVPIIGYKSVIAGLSRDDVHAYYRLAYQPNNVTFVVAGDVPPEEMLATVRKHVAPFPAGREFDRRIASEPPVLAPRGVSATFPKLGQAKLLMGFPTVRLTDPDLYALDLLAFILGRGDGSLLVQELRDRKKLASEVDCYSDTPPYVDGTFAIVAELEPDKIADATSTVLAALRGVAQQGVEEMRLNRAKTQMRAARAFAQQTADSVTSTLAYDLVSTGDSHFSDTYVRRLLEVTNEQIKAVAARHLDPQRLITVTLLPEEPAAGAQTTSRPATLPTRQDASGVVRLALQDGTTVLLRRIATSPTAAIQLWADGGLTQEDAKNNGLGNLAMKLAPRGTKTRSARQIAEFFDSIGGQMQTACGSNSWSWKADILSGDLEPATEVLADVVRTASFPDAEVDAMKQRIIASIRDQEADTTSAAFRFFRSEFFDVESPYRFMAIGSVENVRTFTAEQVRQWYLQRILPSRKVLCIYGDINTDEARRIVQKHFGAARDGAPSITPRLITTTRTAQVAGPASVDIRKVAVNKSANPQAAVVIGFESAGHVSDSGRHALAMADTLTSGWSMPTGYIFETLRGRGLVYDANAFNLFGRSAPTPGCFVAYALCDPKNVNEVADAMLENVARLQGTDADIQLDWFGRARRLTAIADALERQTPSAQAERAGIDELLGLGYDAADRFASTIGTITTDDVRATARARLSRCVVTITTAAPELVRVRTGMRKYERFTPVDLAPRGIEHPMPR